jgi:hypothetical protein
MELTAKLSKEDIDAAVGDWLRKSLPNAQDVNLTTGGSGKNFNASATFTMGDDVPASKKAVIEEVPAKEEEVTPEPTEEVDAEAKEEEVLEKAPNPPKRKAKTLFGNVKTPTED